MLTELWESSNAGATHKLAHVSFDLPREGRTSGFVTVAGAETGRRLLRASPCPPESSPSPSSPAPSQKTSPSGDKGGASPRAPGGYNGDSGLGGITPAKVPGAQYPADVVTCAICQSAVPGRNSTAASDGVNSLYRRGECSKAMQIISCWDNDRMSAIAAYHASRPP